MNLCPEVQFWKATETSGRSCSIPWEEQRISLGQQDRKKGLGSKSAFSGESAEFDGSGVTGLQPEPIWAALHRIYGHLLYNCIFKYLIGGNFTPKCESNKRNCFQKFWEAKGRKLEDKTSLSICSGWKTSESGIFVCVETQKLRYPLGYPELDRPPDFYFFLMEILQMQPLI